MAEKKTTQTTANPAEEAVKATPKKEVKKMALEALGMVENRGLVAAIEAADAMVKAADVKLIHVEKRLGGRLVTVVVEGTVSAVSAALEAGVEAAQAVGSVMCHEVIARPHPDIVKFIKTDPGV